jgi:hypothetical protein
MLQLRTKENKKTRNAFVILCIAFLVLGLAGCGGSSSGSSSSDGDTTAGNTVPVASDGTLAVTQDTVANGTLTATDADDGDTLVYSIVTNGTIGVATITDTATGAYTYTPNTGETGSDSFTFMVNDGTADSNTATVTVTISAPGNTDPTADAGADQSVDELDTVNLTGTGTDADGDSLTYTWSQTGTPAVNITDNGDGTASFTAPAVAADTDLTFSLTVDDGAGGTATDDVVVSVLNAANLSGSVSDVDALVDLTDEGPTDWMHWGRASSSAVNQMDAADVIADNGTIGSSPTTFRIGDDAPTAFFWDNGDDGDSGGDSESDGTRTGIYNSYSAGQTADTYGRQVTVTFADTAQKRLKLYIGAYNGDAKLAVFWNAETTAVYQTTITAPDTQITKVVTLDVGAQTAGDTLTIQYTIGNNANSSFLSLYAVAISPAKVPTPVISAVSGTYAGETDVSITVPNLADAAIYYTTDGSTPTQSSTQYTGQFTVSATSTIKARAFFEGYTESDIDTSDMTIVDASNIMQAAFIEVPGQLIDLEADGTAGWIAWGRNGSNLDQFSLYDGSAGLGDYTTIGTVGSANQITDSPVAFVWTNGDDGDGQGAESTGTRTGVFHSFSAGQTAGVNGVQLAITATDTTMRTLKVYLGAFQGSATVNVTIEGETFTQTITATSAIQQVRVLSVDYQPTAVGQTLSVDYTIDNNTEASFLSLYGASLE